MPRLIRATLAAFPFVAVAHLAAAQGVRPDIIAARVDSVFARWDHSNSPGCLLGVSRDDKLVYQRGYGMSNLEYGLAIGPASVFHVASISKQFTAMSVMLLAQRGRLSLDDDVRTYVSELPDYGSRITIRHLLTHTSGLRDQWTLLGLAGWRDDDLITEDDVLKIVARQKALNFKPGAEYLYSNTGFTLLGVIVRRVSGQTLRAFADSNIFRPLGMGHTHFHDDHTMLVPNRTSAYQPRAGGGWKVSIPVFDTYGATSLFTTAEDLLAWERNFTDARVGGADLVAAMQQPALLTGGDTSWYGAGLQMGRYRGLRTVGHAGADAGYRADVVRFPDQKLAVALMCNLSNIVPGTLARAVAAIYMEAIAPGAMAAAPAPPPPGAGAVALSAEQLANASGLYRNPVTDDVLRIVVRGARLVLSRGAGTELIPVTGTRFLLPGTTTAYEFGATGARRPRELTVLAEAQRPERWQHVDAFTPTAADLRAFAGNYVSDELDITWTIVPQDSALVIRTRKGDDLVIRPTFADAFQGGNLTSVRFTRGAGGRASGFTISAGRVRGVTFVAR